MKSFKDQIIGNIVQRAYKTFLYFKNLIDEKCKIQILLSCASLIKDCALHVEAILQLFPNV